VPAVPRQLLQGRAQIGLRKWLRYHLKKIMLLRDLQQVAGKARG
jgi:hypothetical protein